MPMTIGLSQMNSRDNKQDNLIAAAGQWGPSPPDNLTFGRSMVVNPWGLVVSQAPDGVSHINAELDLDTMREIRTKFPARSHIRRDLFS